MSEFYRPESTGFEEHPFARGPGNTLLRIDFWNAMTDQSIILAMTRGLGAELSNEHKRAHLEDIGRGHLIDQIVTQDVLPPE